MRSFFIFDGKNSKDFNLWIEYLPDAAFPERRGESYQIDGANGVRYREDGTFENVEQSYEVWFRDWQSDRDMYQIGNDIAKWLIGSSGYCRLEDTYNPEYFRLARFAGPLNFQTTLRKFGRGTLVFDCLPQRYLKSGEEAVTSNGSEFTMINPTGFTASPIISVTGSGTIGIRLVSLQGVLNIGYTDIRLAIGYTSKTVVLDCANYTAQVNGEDVDDIVTFYGSDTYPTFPQLRSSTIIATLSDETYTGTVTKIKVVPRWWTL